MSPYCDDFDDGLPEVLVPARIQVAHNVMRDLSYATPEQRTEEAIDLMKTAAAELKRYIQGDDGQNRRLDDTFGRN